MCCCYYKNSSSIDVDLDKASNSMYTFPPISCPIASITMSSALPTHRTPTVLDFVIMEDTSGENGHASFKQTMFKSHSTL